MTCIRSCTHAGAALCAADLAKNVRVKAREATLMGRQWADFRQGKVDMHLTHACMHEQRTMPYV